MFKKLLAITLLATTSPAFAADEDWWYAESDHFRVYSSGEETDAREMAVNLERLDQAMRMFRGLPVDGSSLPESSKPTIYQFGKIDDIGNLAGRQGVAGFFIPRAGNSVAFVPLEEENNRSATFGTRVKGRDGLTPGRVLFHEYSHYFMFQHAPAAYPFWYIEGFAELFGTIEFVEGGFNLGEPPDHRNFALRELTLNVERIINPPSRMTGLDLEGQYAYGWMFTSYLSFEPSRAGQLSKYLTLVNSGKPNLEAAREAFGDLGKLQRELESYQRGRARGISAKFPESSSPDVSVRALTTAENAIMKLHMQSTRGVDKKAAERQVPEVRELLTRFPDTKAVVDAALEVEFDAGNLEAAETLAQKLQVLDEDSVRSRLYLARIAMKKAETDKAQLVKAREFFAEANRLDPSQPEALQGYYLTFVLNEEAAPEHALIALESAYRYAPFDQNIRLQLAHLLLTEKRDEEAIIILGPVVNSPHGGKRAEEYRDLVEKFKAGDRDPLLTKLAPKLKAEDDEEA